MPRLSLPPSPQDWKAIGINAEDPAAELLNDIDDLDVHMPGAAEALHRWLKYYKVRAGQASPRQPLRVVMSRPRLLIC